MDGTRSPDDDRGGVMKFAAEVSRLVGVTTSVIGLTLAAIALIAIAVALILSL